MSSAGRRPTESRSLCRRLRCGRPVEVQWDGGCLPSWMSVVFGRLSRLAGEADRLRRIVCFLRRAPWCRRHALRHRFRCMRGSCTGGAVVERQLAPQSIRGAYVLARPLFVFDHRLLLLATPSLPPSRPDSDSHIYVCVYISSTRAVAHNASSARVSGIYSVD